jgi:hypothetical protein
MPLSRQVDFYADDMPADIQAHRVKLLATRNDVTQFGRYMDGYLFGVVGADAIVSLVPVIGDVFCGLMMFWLLGKAGQVRMPWGERLVIIGLGVLDTVIGMVPVVGDIADFFFRAHGWSAARVNAHIEMQLQQIEAVGPLPTDHPHMHHLRDALFRGGKTKQDVWIRFGIIGAVCAGLLAYCSHQADLRHERILACEARGEWFCSMKN